MKRAPLRFRIRVAGSWFVRVHVLETRSDMLSAVKQRHGAHSYEHAVTVFESGAPERGCVADLFFYWRGLRPGVIAHEASHAAFACAVATKQGIGPDDEHIAAWVEKITERVWLKTQAAAL
jgi:hypothetical protein